MLTAIRPQEPSVPYEHRLISGTPADAIVSLAKEVGAELIVMSSHGRTGLSRVVLGSVAEVVVRKAPCPVLILKRPKHDRKPRFQPSVR
jgi:nucleotide-binding universal stress UspA family protein